MPETDKRNYPYPPGGVEPDVPYWMQQLAEAVDADIADLTFDTDWIDLPITGAWVVSPGGARYRRKSNVVYMQVQLNARTWPENTSVAILPPGFRPKYRQNYVSQFGLWGESHNVQIESDGVITARTGNSFSNVGLTFSGSFPID
jgi:hypothetical protein